VDFGTFNKEDSDVVCRFVCGGEEIVDGTEYELFPDQNFGESVFFF
jgi:hypothetical protein